MAALLLRHAYLSEAVETYVKHISRCGLEKSSNSLAVPLFSSNVALVRFYPLMFWRTLPGRVSVLSFCSVDLALRLVTSQVTCS
jgi:hypothetical protein